jgi:uncharacterized protein
MLTESRRQGKATVIPDVLTGLGSSALNTRTRLRACAHMIADARANGFKIILSCQYVQAQYMRHPEWTDLRAASTSREVKRD